MKRRELKRPYLEKIRIEHKEVVEDLLMVGQLAVCRSGEQRLARTMGQSKT